MKAMLRAVATKTNGGPCGPPRMELGPTLGELGEQRPRFVLLLIVAFVQDFLQDLASAFHVAHFLIRLGEVQLGRSIVPLTVEHRRGGVLEGRALRIEGEVKLVELDRRRGASKLRRIPPKMAVSLRSLRPKAVPVRTPAARRTRKPSPATAPRSRLLSRRSRHGTA